MPMNTRQLTLADFLETWHSLGVALKMQQGIWLSEESRVEPPASLAAPGEQMWGARGSVETEGMKSPSTASVSQSQVPSKDLGALHLVFVVGWFFNPANRYVESSPHWKQKNPNIQQEIPQVWECLDRPAVNYVRRSNIVLQEPWVPGLYVLLSPSHTLLSAHSLSPAPEKAAATRLWCPCVHALTWLFS